MKKENQIQSIFFSFGFRVGEDSLPFQVSELITESLIRFVKAEPKDQVPASVRKASPLLLGLSVFKITRNLSINLGVKGWAELCLLLSSEAATDNSSLDEASVLFPRVQ